MVVASNSYTNSTWVISGGSGSLVESKWCHYVMVKGQPPQTASCIHIRHMESVWAHWYTVLGAKDSSLKLKQLFPHYFYQILGFWITCGVKMMSLHLGLGWQPTQTASCIHIIHIQSVWAYQYAVHGHMVVASNNYTHPTWLILCGSGSLVESKWCHYVMVEADNQLELLPISKSYI